MPIKHPTSGGQACGQITAVQQTFHLVKSNFFYLSALMVKTHSCSPEVKPRPKKTIHTLTFTSSNTRSYSCSLSYTAVTKCVAHYQSNDKDSTQCLLACILHTAALNTDPDSCLPEVQPRKMKTLTFTSSLNTPSYSCSLSYTAITR